ncbi:MAG: type II/IV secretion system protein [Candidatus Colwellbacteria bacterium]|nr:type II/IV secretion system protein [Candidatus Colwellbacteria bacterium]
MPEFTNTSDAVAQKLAIMRREGEEREAKRLAETLNLPYVNLDFIPTDLSALKLAPEDIAKSANLVPFKLKGKDAIIASILPKSKEAMKVIKGLESKGYSVQVFVCSQSSLERGLKRYKELSRDLPELVSRVDITEGEFGDLKKAVAKVEDIERVLDGGASKTDSTTHTLGVVLASALAIHASDIHFESKEEDALMRFRIDGVLYDAWRLPKERYRTLLNRMKLLSGLKINITDAPQDGRFTVRVGRSDIEIRFSVIPSEFGEAVVMRVLDPSAISITLTQLGLRKDLEDVAKKEIKRPNGMILVTGPTGSGKTTTLYAFLKSVANPELKIITVEDPIEYHLSGIQQTQVDNGAGYTFASGLRSILRQDPDMILVGEIRDKETAEIAINASLTGHLVFSTLHTNNAMGAIPRLIDMGAKTSVLGPSLTLVIAQRLVRKLCENCKVKAEFSEGDRKKIESFIKTLPKYLAPSFKTPALYKAVGCAKCTGGYKGRVGVFEFLEFGEEYEELIKSDASESAIRKIALTHGFVGMQADGILKYLSGVTTLEEVEKVTGPIEWRVGV